MNAMPRWQQNITSYASRTEIDQDRYYTSHLRPQLQDGLFDSRRYALEWFVSRQVLVNLETTHITLSSVELESFMRIEKTYLDNIVRNSLETFAGFTLWKIFGLRGNKAELRKIGSYNGTFRKWKIIVSIWYYLCRRSAQIYRNFLCLCTSIFRWFRTTWCR